MPNAAALAIIPAFNFVLKFLFFAFAPERNKE
jgi:hypothetical protein